MSSIPHWSTAAPEAARTSQFLDDGSAAIRAIADPPVGGCPCCLVEAGEVWPENNPRSFICSRHAAAMVARSNALKSRVEVQHA